MPKSHVADDAVVATHIEPHLRASMISSEAIHRNEIEASRRPLRVLLVEESAPAAGLIVRELSAIGRPFEVEQVEDESGMRAALDRSPWDVVISEWSLSRFSANDALRALREHGLRTPFLVVSVTMGEKAAVEAVRAGSQEFVDRDRPARLAVAVQSELREIQARQRSDAALRHSEELLQDTEARFRAMIEKNTDLILLLSREGRILYVSPAVDRLLQCSPEECVGRSVFELIHPDDRGRIRNTLLRLVLHSIGSTHAEFRVAGQDGCERWIEATCTNLLEDRAVCAVVGNFRDVTDRKRAELTLRQTEEQLRQAHKMEAIGSFAGGIAHDFNNLLSIILSYAALLTDDLPSGDPRRASLDEIEAAGQRAVALTRQLLSFSRKQILQPKVISLNDVITRLERMLRRLIGEDIELRVLLSADLSRIKADPGQMEQVVMNLVANSRDAMPNGGTLTIETRNVVLPGVDQRNQPGVPPEDQVVLVVTDTGNGMDEATRQRIFEPFFTTKEADRGTGIGLATVLGIVQQGGGNVVVRSEVGQGTSIKVCLPKTDESPQCDSYISALAPAGGFDGTETILLVEDEERVRLVLSTILRRHGHRVLEAKNGGDALLIAEQYDADIDLMITDVVMPRMSGRQVAEVLQPTRPNMKVLFMSGYTDDAVVRRGVLDSGIAFLHKPITPLALMRKVRKVLGRSRGHGAGARGSAVHVTK